jgi:membrane-bound lytic murein transglycosylase B
MRSGRGVGQLLVIVLAIAAGARGADAAREDFGRWLEKVAAEAREQGISEATIRLSLDGLEPIASILESDRTQPRKPADFCGYLSKRLTKTRIARGKRMLAEHTGLLHRVSGEFGVPPRFIVSLWGLETNFGDYLGDHRVIEALATLAYDERRGPMFREQLFAALRIVDEGHQSPTALTGSWAGAMGQVQFMPTTFLSYAVDFDGDGRKDVWTSLPDSFASAANYLRRAGWRSGQTWGREVQLPKTLRADGDALKKSRSLDEWRRLGVRRIDGGELPSGRMRGAMRDPMRRWEYPFLVYSNFHALLRWNNSTFFGISVGALADELTGVASLRACR